MGRYPHQWQCRAKWQEWDPRGHNWKLWKTVNKQRWWKFRNHQLSANSICRSYAKKRGGALNLNRCRVVPLLDHMQIYKVPMHGLRLRGGAVSVREIAITQSLGTSLRWEAGWRGTNTTVGHISGKMWCQTRLLLSVEKVALLQNYLFLIPKSTTIPLGRGDNTGIRLEDQTRCLACQWHHCPYRRAIRTDALDYWS